jgi:hypothetical protein
VLRYRKHQQCEVHVNLSDTGQSSAHGMLLDVPVAAQAVQAKPLVAIIDAS